MEWGIAALLVAGAGFVLVAALGVLRLPDLYMRMHASTKPATLGTSLLAAALALHAADPGIAARALLVVLFFLLTAPVAAHRLGRAAHRSGVPLWRGSVADALADGSPDAARRTPGREPPR
jgi:multicomponent Na+:H+ antiporter subunit G